MRRAQLRRALAAGTVVACLTVTATALTASGATAQPSADRAGAVATPDHKGGPKPKPKPEPGKPGKPKPPKPTPSPTPSPEPGSDVTDPAEAARVDRVPTPDPEWWDCGSVFMPRAQCATIELPLDYDEPDGPTTEIAVLRMPATDPDKKVGSLFVNPGGPGGSSVEFAGFSEFYLSPELTEKFDVVGVDPRGIGYSENVQCFRNMGEQDAALKGMDVQFPQGDEQEAAFVDSARKLGTACSTKGAPLSASMSTAEVARDMDVVRRLVGDEKLTYLGFSYGSYLGQVYANLFPDRVRAVAIDGVLDPLGWAGTPETADVPVTARIESGAAAWRAAQEILDRCAEAGEEQCRTASIGDPHEVWDGVVAGLRETPVELRDPETDELYVTVDWPLFAGVILSSLYYPDGYLDVDGFTWAFHWLLQPETPENAEVRAEALGSLIGYQKAQLEAAAERAAEREQRAKSFGFAFPYWNGTEAFSAVLCTDSLNPADAADWIPASRVQDEKAPGFGPSWTWGSAPCATSTWTAQDDDAYRGAFDARTAAPVLVVGNLWDPATSYDGALAAAEVLPNSRLLSSDSWGHTAYGTSTCATDAIDRYVLAVEVPAEGTQCTGDVQPFQDQPQTFNRQQQRQLPPVVPPVPGADPRS